MLTKSDKAVLAAKYKALIKDLQTFFDSQSDSINNSPECEALTQAQSEFATAYEELTGKPIF